jgi:hypothetical protein
MFNKVYFRIISNSNSGLKLVFNFAILGIFVKENILI